jgi:hypothetical protein
MNADEYLDEYRKAFDSGNAVDPLSKGRPTQEARLLGSSFRTSVSETGMCLVSMRSQPNRNGDFACGEITHEFK